MAHMARTMGGHPNVHPVRVPQRCIRTGLADPLGPSRRFWNSTGSEQLEAAATSRSRFQHDRFSKRSLSVEEETKQRYSPCRVAGLNPNWNCTSTRSARHLRSCHLLQGLREATRLRLAALSYWLVRSAYTKWLAAETEASETMIASRDFTASSFVLKASSHEPRRENETLSEKGLQISACLLGWPHQMSKGGPLAKVCQCKNKSERPRV